jgi:hypothetical protein
MINSDKLSESFPSASPLEKYVFILKDELDIVYTRLQKLESEIAILSQPPNKNINIVGGIFSATFFVRFCTTTKWSYKQFAQALCSDANIAFHFAVFANFEHQGVFIIEGFVACRNYYSFVYLSHKLHELQGSNKPTKFNISLTNLGRVYDAVMTQIAIINKQKYIEQKITYTYYYVDPDNKLHEDHKYNPMFKQTDCSNTWQVEHLVLE